MTKSPTAIPGRILVDTAAYFALVDHTDVNHSRAISIASADRQVFFTTNYVLAEAHALMLRRLGRVVAARFLVDTDRGRTTVVRVRPADERRAREIIFTYTDKDFSLTDATSFAVMERLHIGTAFTFDRHFAQFGFAVLGPDDS